MKAKNPVVLREGTAPTPSSGHVALYSTDGSVLMMKDDAGVVTTLGGGTTISGMTSATTLTGTETFPGVQSSANVKVTTAQIGAFTTVHNASTSTQTPAAATDVLMTGSTLAIPSGFLKAGTKARWDLSITKSTAGTGTPTVNIRFGTGGVVGDTSRCAFTWPAANTAIADEMMLTVQATFRAVGSGTTAVIEGMMMGLHEQTTTGFGGTGLTNVIIVNTTGGGFDSTVASSILSLSINGGTASAWSIRQVHAVLENR